jgi:nuclear cap-binding protein subunit 2
VDWDVGFEEGRQFGRGKGGIQRRDQFRKTEDPDRPFFKPH